MYNTQETTSDVIKDWNHKNSIYDNELQGVEEEHIVCTGVFLYSSREDTNLPCHESSQNRIENDAFNVDSGTTGIYNTPHNSNQAGNSEKKRGYAKNVKS